MNRSFAWLTLLLCGCQTVSSEPPPLFTLAQIKADPVRFLVDYKGRRIRVSGIFAVDRLTTSCDLRAKPAETYFDLILTGAKFEQAWHRPVVLEAVLRAPHDLRLGGGDLVIEVPASEQDVYLTNTKLLSFESSAVPCP